MREQAGDREAGAAPMLKDLARDLEELAIEVAP
jgi:hypothetical protein